MRTVWNLVVDEQASETLEWALACGLIVASAVAVIVLIGPKVNTMWTNMNAGMSKP